MVLYSKNLIYYLQKRDFIMIYAMCLDSSWNVMCEEESYDVNGGFRISNSVLIVSINLAIIAIGIGWALCSRWLARKASKN